MSIPEAMAWIVGIFATSNLFILTMLGLYLHGRLKIAKEVECEKGSEL